RAVGAPLVADPGTLTIIVAVLALLLARAGGARRAIAALLAIAVTSRVADIMAIEHPWVSYGYLWLFAPAAIGAIGAWVGGAATGPARRIAAPLVIAGLAVVWSAASWRTMLVLPTDALEYRAAMAWRRELPSGAAVVYVGSSAYRALVLPLYVRGVDALSVRG